MAEAQPKTTPSADRQARVVAGLTQIATGKALVAAPYGLTQAQAQAVGVATLTALLATDRQLLKAFVAVLLGV